MSIVVFCCVRLISEAPRALYSHTHSVTKFVTKLHDYSSNYTFGHNHIVYITRYGKQFPGEYSTLRRQLKKQKTHFYKLYITFLCMKKLIFTNVISERCEKHRFNTSCNHDSKKKKEVAKLQKKKIIIIIMQISVKNEKVNGI